MEEGMDLLRKLFGIFVAGILAIVIMLLVASYYSDSSFGANIEKYEVLNESSAMIKLSAGTNLDNISSVIFVFSDSSGNTYTYETKDGAQNISVPYTRFFFWKSYKGEYAYPITSDDLGIDNFEDIVSVEVMFKYDSSEDETFSTQTKTLDKRIITSDDTKSTKSSSKSNKGSSPGDSSPSPPEETAPIENCTDGIKNQDETDVDCGGVCPACVVEVCVPSKTCSNYPDNCSVNLFNGCNYTLDCSNSCSSDKVCSFGACIDSTPEFKTPSDYFSYWTLDSDASDLSGQNNGEVIGALSSLGIVEGSYSFDGIDDYIQLSSSPTAGKSKITLSMWVKINEIDIDNTLYDEYYNKNRWVYSILQDKWYTRSNVLSSAIYLDMPVLSVNEWSHLVFVYDADNDFRGIYLDGSLVKSSTASIGPINSTRDANAFRIGYACDGDNFNGTIDEVIFYERVLNESEVVNIFCSQGGQGSVCDESGLVVENCLDGIKNQDETDVDCGGSCLDCSLGKSCLVNSDCSTNNCTNKVCVNNPVVVNPVCGDGICTGEETCSSCSNDCGDCPVVAVCGDGTCNGEENCDSCSADCGECEIVPAGTYYVSVTGAGLHDGSSPSNAMTLTEAKENPNAGKTFLLLSGNYGDVTFGQARNYYGKDYYGTSWSSPVTYKPAQGADVVFTKLYIGGHGDEPNLDRYLIIDGIKVITNDYKVGPVTVRVPGSIKLKNLYVKGITGEYSENCTTTGIYIVNPESDNSVKDITVEGCEVISTSPGIDFTGRINNGIIRNNHIHDTHSSGIKLSVSQDYGIILAENNIIHDQNPKPNIAGTDGHHGSGFAVRSRGVILRNNTIYDYGNTRPMTFYWEVFDGAVNFESSENIVGKFEKGEGIYQEGSSFTGKYYSNGTKNVWVLRDSDELKFVAGVGDIVGVNSGARLKNPINNSIRTFGGYQDVIVENNLIYFKDPNKYEREYNQYAEIVDVGNNFTIRNNTFISGLSVDFANANDGSGFYLYNNLIKSYGSGPYENWANINEGNNLYGGRPTYSGCGWICYADEINQRSNSLILDMTSTYFDFRDEFYDLFLDNNTYDYRPAMDKMICNGSLWSPVGVKAAGKFDCAEQGDFYTCVDGIKNQDESDVDCGGVCGDCGLGKSCLVNSDCSTNNCTNKVCVNSPAVVNPVCGDGTCNGVETCSSCPSDCGDCVVVPTCTLTNAYWNSSSVDIGENVLMSVDGENCDGENIYFEVWKQESLFGVDLLWPDKKIYDSVSAQWSAGYDGADYFEGTYYFKARLDDGTSISSKDMQNGIVGVLGSCEITYADWVVV